MMLTIVINMLDTLMSNCYYFEVVHRIHQTFQLIEKWHVILLKS